METRCIVGSEGRLKTYSTKESLFSFHVNNVWLNNDIKNSGLAGHINLSEMAVGS
jgi:hypothetical protein